MSAAGIDVRNVEAMSQPAMRAVLLCCGDCSGREVVMHVCTSRAAGFLSLHACATAPPGRHRRGSKRPRLTPASHANRRQAPALAMVSPPTFAWDLTGRRRLAPNASSRRGGVILRTMGGQDQRRRSRSGRLLDSLVWGAALGAAAGAVLGAAISGIGAGVGALIGVLLYAPAEAITSLSRGAGDVKPLWQRIISSALLMALFGGLLGLIGLDEPLTVGIVSGALLGLVGLRPLKILL